MRKIELTLITSFLSLSMVIGCGTGVQGASKYITRDNCVMVDGRPFFPIGIYSVYPVSAIDDIKEAGFNSAHTYEYDAGYLKEFIRSAENAGLKVMIYPGSRLEKPGFDMKNVEKTVSLLAKSPAILSWYLTEEPDLFNIGPGEIWGKSRAIGGLDRAHPVSMLIAAQREYRNYANSADIFMIESYPVPNHPLTKVAEDVEAARKAAGGNVPVWAVLQAFGYHNDRNKGWGWGREPTFQEMKAMTYLSIVQGARGIFYFTYYGSQYMIRDSPRHWEELKAVVKELRGIYPLLTASDDGGVAADVSAAGNEKAVFWTVRRVAEGNSQINPGRYIIAVNGSDRPAAATFELKDKGHSAARALLEERILKISEGSFTDAFAPYEVHIYSLE